MPSKPDQRAIRYVQLCAHRVRGSEEGWIAKELGYEAPDALYEQLSRDGFPVCTVCGETPARIDHCEPMREARRKARKSTEEARLPSPQTAEGSFRLALAWLEEDVASLHLFEERLQGERFVGMLNEPEGELFLYRRMFYESDWERLCSLYGLEPAPGQLDVEGTGTTQPYGANPTPARPLVRLIAAYALVYDALIPLVDRLHPDPASIDEKKLADKVDQLGLMAGQLATLVRGGTVRTGPSTGKVSREEQRIAWAISRRRKEGASDERILREIAYMGFDAYGRRVTKDDVSRLGDLQLGPPD